MIIGNVKLEAVPVFELLDADETDEVVGLDALLRIVVLHRLHPVVLFLHVDLVTQAAWERLQTGKTPAAIQSNTIFLNTKELENSKVTCSWWTQQREEQGRPVVTSASLVAREPDQACQPRGPSSD